MGRDIVMETIKPGGLLPWSPSWGEITYRAFDIPTVEFHNELYGYIEEKCKEKAQKYFKQEADNKVWNYSTKTEESVSLCKYVRNCIHHPESVKNHGNGKKNKEYESEELKKSIEIMKDFLVKK